MGLFSSLFPRHLIGLDIGVSGVKAVELSSAKTPRLVAYNRVPLPRDTISAEGEIKNRELLVQALRKLFQSGFSSKRVAVGAFGNSIMTKKISLPRMSEEELSHQLYWEAEQYIPFSLEDVNLDFAILNESENPSAEETMEVLLVAAKKDYIQSLKTLMEEAGLTPDVIDAQAFALGNVFAYSYAPRSGSQTLNAIIDFGAGTTKVSLVEGQKTTFTRELRQCGLLCTQLLSDRLKISFDDAEKLKVAEPPDSALAPLVQEFIYPLVEELARTVDFAVGQALDKTLEGIYVCGGGSRLNGLMAALEEKMPAPVSYLNPIQNVSGSGKKMNANAVRELSSLGAVAIGLALRKAGDAP